MDIEANVRYSGWTYHPRENIVIGRSKDSDGSVSGRSKFGMDHAISSHPVAQAWQAISAAVVCLPRNYHYRAFLVSWAVPVDGTDSGHGVVNRAARKHGIPHMTAARVVQRFLRERNLPVPRTWTTEPRERERAHG